MPTYPGDGANSANPQEGEHVTGFSRGPDPMGQNRLRGMELLVAPPTVDEARYLTPHLATRVTLLDVYDTLRRSAQQPARALEAVDRNGTIIYGAARPLTAQVRHLYEHRPVPPVDVQQHGPPRYHWLPIAIDGTKRHGAGYAHCTIGGTTSLEELANWCLMGGSEQWSTIYALAQEVDFDQELRRRTGNATTPLFPFRR